MPITFDHVEGVVQKASEPTASGPAQPTGAAAQPPKPTAETFEETRHRMEQRARRLHAD